MNRYVDKQELFNAESNATLEYSAGKIQILYHY